MRELNGHKVNSANDILTVTALDEPGPGGASHAYLIDGALYAKNASLKAYDGRPLNGSTFVGILFQNGPIPEVGVNGITHEALIAILIDRLEGFQAGKFSCAENADALVFLIAAQKALQSRTRNRLQRGVEGTHEV